MNKVDPFFVLILALLSALTVVYHTARLDVGSAHWLAIENRQLKAKIKLLELKQADLEMNTSALSSAKKRYIASVNTRSQVNPEESLEANLETNPNKLAEGLYQEVVKQCIKSKKDWTCLDKVDSIVTQFPDSKWAGRSLLVLTERYIREKRYEQASNLIHIVRHEFKNDPDVQKSLKEIEKLQL